jgi:hypothetical protein
MVGQGCVISLEQAWVLCLGHINLWVSSTLDQSLFLASHGSGMGTLPVCSPAASSWGGTCSPSLLPEPSTSEDGSLGFSTLPPLLVG